MLLSWDSIAGVMLGATEENASAATGSTPSGAAGEDARLNEDRQRLARRYARQRRQLALASLALGAAIILVVLLGGLSFSLRDALAPLARWQPVPRWAPLQIAAYFGALYAILFVLDLPFAAYGGFVLPHRYQLATRSLRGWIVDLLKGQALALTFQLALVEFVFCALALAPNTWWLWVGVALLLATVVLANVGPILVVPLFYKLTPLHDGEVKARLLALADRAHTRVRGVYSMNLSVRTKAANAMVMGLGNTRRIIVGDTLLNTFTPDEIEVIMAHELGHQVHRDIPKLILVQSSVTLGGLYLVNVALHAVVGATPRYVGVADVATMPLLAALAGLFGVITLPLNNAFSRWVERQADAYALESTHKTAAFIGAMTRLANQNLAEADPAPWVELLLHDHPSIGRRLAFARRYAGSHSNAP